MKVHDFYHGFFSAAIWIDLAPAGVDVTRYPQKSLCTDEGGPAPKDTTNNCAAQLFVQRF